MGLRPAAIDPLVCPESSHVEDKAASEQPFEGQGNYGRNVASRVDDLHTLTAIYAKFLENYFSG